MDSLINHHNNLANELELITKAKNFAQFAYADNTVDSYRKDWLYFESWCESKNIQALPSHINTLILYVTELASEGKKFATIQRRICGIVKRHNLSSQSLNLKDANFLLVWGGIKRKLGTAKKGKAPLLLKTLRIIIQSINKTNAGIRNRALITFGWASAMRRSEIVALNWSDIEYVNEGLLVNIQRSKTDQYGTGQKIAILYGNNPETCPIKSLKNWHAIGNHNEAIFTSINKADRITNIRLLDRDIARILKKTLLNAGIDPTNFAAHSLRSGFITTAAKHSVPDHIIMKHSRHKTIQMLKVYTRDDSLIQDNPTSMVGL